MPDAGVAVEDRGQLVLGVADAGQVRDGRQVRSRAGCGRSGRASARGSSRPRRRSPRRTTAASACSWAMVCEQLLRRLVGLGREELEAERRRMCLKDVEDVHVRDRLVPRELRARMRTRMSEVHRIPEPADDPSGRLLRPSRAGLGSGNGANRQVLSPPGESVGALPTRPRVSSAGHSAARTPILGQIASRPHSLQRGFRARQIRRPWWIRRWLRSTHCGSGNDGHQVCARFARVLVGRQAQPVGQPLDVGVDDDARGDAEGGAQHDVGRLAADAGQGGQCVEVAGDLAVVCSARCSAIA